MMFRALVDELQAIVDDVSSLEAGVIDQGSLRAYSKVSIEGDTTNLISGPKEYDHAWIAELQAAQTQVALSAKLTLLRTATATLKAIKPI